MMKTALIFSFSDIGKNERMLRYAQSLVTKKKMKVILVGYDISDIPIKYTKLPNLKIRYIFPFLYNHHFLQTLFWPFQFIFYLIQMIGIAVNISSVNLIICSSTFYVIETVCGLIISKIHNSILIFDITYFLWYDNEITSCIVKRILSSSTYLICPSHSIEVVLNLAGFRPFIIPNVVDSSFHLNEKVKNKVCNFLNVDQNSILISVPIAEFDHELINCLEDACHYLKKSDKNVVIIVFGSGKSKEKFKEKIKNISIQKVEIKFVPFQYDAYPMILGASDVGVYFPEPSFVFELSPQILAIAASGIPIITVQFGCANEIVKDNVNGVIIQQMSDLGPKLKEIFVNKSIDFDSLRKNAASLNLKENADSLLEKAFDEILS